jgi:hypothetical protein
MGNGEQSPQEHTYTAHNNICDAKKWVFTTHDSTCGEQDGFGSTVSIDRKICASLDYLHEKMDGKPTIINIKLIETSFHGLIVVPKGELAESRQSSCSHPHMKFLVL